MQTIPVRPLRGPSYSTQAKYGGRGICVRALDRGMKSCSGVCFLRPPTSSNLCLAHMHHFPDLRELKGDDEKVYRKNLVVLSQFLVDHIARNGR